MNTSNSPFIFGRKATGSSFTDRENETARLISNFSNLVNTVIISPRRWGKSSLVKKAGETAADDSLKVVFIDAFGIRDSNEFYSVLANEVIKSTSNKLETWIEQLRSFYSRISPKFSFGTDPLNTFDISFDLELIEKNYQEILDLPENIAKNKAIKIVICIDEFQNTAGFSDSDLFHKRLRTSWQNHQSVSYCIYGSKKHMMSALFEKQSRPFYKFGETIHLSKISLENWISYITTQFQSTGKSISVDLATRIAATVKCHSYYVQQLSHLTWLGTDDVANDLIFDKALEDLLSQNAILYQHDTELLKETQLNFLKAIASGVENHFSSKDIITRFKLSSSANVAKLKKTLVEKELIEIQGLKVEFLDPAYELWFKREILKQNIY